jgi:hypothetical protein
MFSERSFLRSGSHSYCSELGDLPFEAGVTSIFYDDVPDTLRCASMSPETARSLQLCLADDSCQLNPMNPVKFVGTQQHPGQLSQKELTVEGPQ